MIKLIQSLIITEANAAELISSAVEEKDSLLLTYMNAHCFNVAWSQPEYAGLLSEKYKVFTDGIGMYVACRVLLKEKPQRLSATEFFGDVYGRYINNHRIFILGGNPGSDTEGLLRLKHNNLCGYHHGYFENHNINEIADKIRKASPDIIMIGMGVPKQEFTGAEIAKLLPGKVILCVGNFFEFHTGNIKRAPVIIRKIGLEWLFRMFTEPARLWKRYLIGNPLFVLRITGMQLRLLLLKPRPDQQA